MPTPAGVDDRDPFLNRIFVGEHDHGQPDRADQHRPGPQAVEREQGTPVAAGPDDDHDAERHQRRQIALATNDVRQQISVEGSHVEPPAPDESPGSSDARVRPAESCRTGTTETPTNQSAALPTAADHWWPWAPSPTSRPRWAPPQRRPTRARAAPAHVDHGGGRSAPPHCLPGWGLRAGRQPAAAEFVDHGPVRRLGMQRAAQDNRAPVPGHFIDDLDQRALSELVHSGRRFVQDQQLRGDQQCLDETDPLGVSLGQLPQGCITLGKFEPIHQARRATGRGVGGESANPAHVPQIGDRRQLRPDGKALGHITNRAWSTGHRAGGGTGDAGHDVQQGRLPGAVGPGDRDQLTGRDVEVDLGQHPSSTCVPLAHRSQQHDAPVCPPVPGSAPSQNHRGERGPPGTGSPAASTPVVIGRHCRCAARRPSVSRLGPRTASSAADAPPRWSRWVRCGVWR